MGNLLPRVRAWIAQPYNSDMDVYGWALLTILVISVALLWAQVLRTIERV